MHWERLERSRRVGRLKALASETSVRFLQIDWWINLRLFFRQMLSIFSVLLHRSWRSPCLLALDIDYASYSILREAEMVSPTVTTRSSLPTHFDHTVGET